MNELMARARETLTDGGAQEVAAKAARYARARMATSVATAALARSSRSAASIDDVIDLVYGFDVLGVRIAPFQFRAEIRELLGVLGRRRPRTIVEIGTCTGGSLFLFTRVADPAATLITVDLLHGPFGGGYSPARAPLYRSFARSEQRVELVRGDSHAQATIERVSSLLGGRSVDFLFVDGDHTYEGVRSDFEHYSQLVGAGGLLGFHDIVPGPEEAVGGVPRFWSELRARYPAREIVADWEQGSAGIGLIEGAALRGEAVAAA